MGVIVDYANAREVSDLDTIYITGAGFVNKAFKGIGRDSALGWEEAVWGAELARSNNFTLENIDDVDFGKVARCEITFPLVNIKEFEYLQKLLHERHIIVNFYNADLGKRVTQEMAITGNERDKIHNFGSKLLGMRGVSVKMVATNRDLTDIGSKFTISYDANGGTGLIDSDEEVYSNAYTVKTPNELSKDGYFFSHWSTSSDDSGFRYIPNERITIWRDIALYAIWKEWGFTDGFINLDTLKPIISLTQHDYDELEDYETDAQYVIVDAYGETDKVIYNGTLLYNRFPENVVVFQSDEARTITPKYTNGGVTLQYSVDSGDTWNTIESDTATSSSKEIWFRGRAIGTKSLFTNIPSTNAWSFSGASKLRIKGNLNFLLCDELGDTTAPTVLADYCYTHMFNGCTSLIQSPTLPATTLAKYCYRHMFYECTNLVNAPILPATTLDRICYAYMFACCTNLAKAPKRLPAMTLSNFCYRHMFYNCINLIKAPELPATTLTDSCYSQMFDGCSNLKEITLHYQENNNPNYAFLEWVGNITSAGVLYKAGSQFTNSGGNTYPSTWAQVQI